MTSLLDLEWNKAIDVSIQKIKDHQLALRSMNGESESWVWPAARHLDNLVDQLEFMKRK